MTTVFLSGSRKISRINDDIRQRLDNMVSNGLSIVVGDANGADKAMQSYLFQMAYRSVVVFCAGQQCRNNIGQWETRHIAVPQPLTGRAFYQQKDLAMADAADLGLVLWDGESAGSLANIAALLKRGKKAVVYIAPARKFLNMGSEAELRDLIAALGQENGAKLRETLRLPEDAAPGAALLL